MNDNVMSFVPALVGAAAGAVMVAIASLAIVNFDFQVDFSQLGRPMTTDEVIYVYPEEVVIPLPDFRTSLDYRSDELPPMD